MIYTTGQVARLVGVATKTVIKWCESERLPSWHVPGSTHRRINRRDLEQFLAANGLPTITDFEKMKEDARGP